MHWKTEKRIYMGLAIVAVLVNVLIVVVMLGRMG